jgi:hypothetical protein
MENLYHATPYDISATGFYFKTYEDYTNQAATHRNEYGDEVDEFEIQYIDGDNYELFKALSVNQANLEQWFDEFENLDGEDLIKAIYLASDLNYDIGDILSSLDDVYLFEGTAEEYADDYLESTGTLDQIPENLRFYFDVALFARDMLWGGDISEVTIAGTDYIAQGV